MENNTFESIKIGLASPEQIKSWGRGEVTKPETINYRTLKPEKDGLFCERIFGPTKDWECHCGKYKRIQHKGITCDRCGVEVTKAKVRRERMGYIELAAPVSHIWYFKGTPSRIAQILNITSKDLERVLYYSAYIVTKADEDESDYGGYSQTEAPPYLKQVLDEKEYMDKREKFGDDFEAEMGAGAIQKLLEKIDLDELSAELREELKSEKTAEQKKQKILKRLEIVEAFRTSGNRPEWMILNVVPVIPPELRPMVQLDGGRFATSDLNELYRRVINRNNRLKKFLEIGAPEIIVRNEKRMLQEAVDALIDNGRRGRPVTGPNNRELKSLSHLLKGKQGRFRQNLLGKRVDYSGRSVIVVGPELKLYQCGLPKEMALELFKPFVMKRLVESGAAGNVKSARKMVEKANTNAVWDALEVVIKDHPVMLNRAPTLHRLGIQAFEPVLVEGRAIKLHPLVCTAFNADFDGDQMAVHVPLSAEAQSEARFLMLAANNLLKPSDGRPVAVPTQDMILGSYYLTLEKPSDLDDEGDPEAIGSGMEFDSVTAAFDAYSAGTITDNSSIKVSVTEVLNEVPETRVVNTTINKLSTINKTFRNVEEATMAYDEGIITLHTPIRVRMTKEIEGVEYTRTVPTTLGKIIFNDPIPQDLGFVKRDPKDIDSMFRLEIEFLVKKGNLGKIIDRCIHVHGTARAAIMLDAIKAQGYKHSTRSGITVAVCDATIPPKKKQLLEEAETKIDKINRNYDRGLITNEGRSEKVIDVWEKCTSEVAKELKANFDRYNPINMMLDSGARGNDSQLRQLAGMRGLIANTAGKTIEVPIKANYREGLNILEYFISSRGARKGLADTALRTADSGYLTRRLVDVSQDVIIHDEDCGCTEGIEVYDIFHGERKIVDLAERLTGRYLLDDYVDVETGEVIMSKNQMMSDSDAQRVANYAKAAHQAKIDAGEADENSVATVTIRSLLTCKAPHGVCIKCYGSNLATGEPVTVGEAVGIIAAQSIGEPGTQLTMRTFHTGGAKDAGDITQGLPRIDELFEARKPKALAILSEIDGVVSFEDIKKSRHVVITNQETGDRKQYLVTYGLREIVNDGDVVHKGQALTDGSPNPADILAISGVKAVHDYLICEVQKTYRTQGVDINDKHIEVIVRQMMRKIKIDDPGDTQFLPGAVVEKSELYAENEKIEAENEAEGTELKPATYSSMLLGITKSALATESFLSAASFQETTRVLTDAATKGKTDRLMGLKENVIIGKLLPSGTGMGCYANVEIKRVSED